MLTDFTVLSTQFTNIISHILKLIANVEMKRMHSSRRWQIVHCTSLSTQFTWDNTTPWLNTLDHQIEICLLLLVFCVDSSTIQSTLIRWQICMWRLIRFNNISVFTVVIQFFRYFHFRAVDTLNLNEFILFLAYAISKDSAIRFSQAKYLSTTSGRIAGFSEKENIIDFGLLYHTLLDAERRN